MGVKKSNDDVISGQKRLNVAEIDIPPLSAIEVMFITLKIDSNVYGTRIENY